MPILSSVLAANVMAPLPLFGLYIDGTALNDNLYGTSQNDEMHGRGGNDYLAAGAGNDLLFGEAGDDVLDGGTGNDYLVGGAGADQLIGGDGFDTVSYAGSSGGVWVDLVWNYASGGDAQGDTFSGIEKVVGSSYGDVLIAADSGTTLEGGAGNDSLRGGAGVDVLNGGTGDDYLTGGAGADIFELNWGDGSDVVLDFQQGADKIALGAGFHPTVTGPHGHGTFGRDGQLLKGLDLSEVSPPDVGLNHPGGDRLFYDTDDHQLYQLSIDYATLTVQGELLATFANGVDLQTSDFIFI